MLQTNTTETSQPIAYKNDIITFTIYKIHAGFLEKRTEAVIRDDGHELLKKGNQGMGGGGGEMNSHSTNGICK